MTRSRIGVRFLNIDCNASARMGVLRDSGSRIKEDDMFVCNVVAYVVENGSSRYQESAQLLNWAQLMCGVIYIQVSTVTAT